MIKSTLILLTLILSVSKLNAQDSIKSVIDFLSEVEVVLEDEKIASEIRIRKFDSLIQKGSGMQTLLENHLLIIHPQNKQFQKELNQEFKLVMQSLVLYKSDLKENDFIESESGNNEFEYLQNRIPSLITRLKILTPDYKNLDWVNNKIEELNGYLQAAYGNDAPIHFTIEGIYSKDAKSISWQDVKNLTVKRNEGKVSITNISGRDLQFNFTENQYTHIASMHVHFLAFYEKIAKTVGGNSVNRNAINQADLERATQILNELLPNENYFVTETGIRDKDFGMVIDFSVNKQLDKPVIIIDEDSSKFELCCFSGMEEDENGIMNDHYYSTSFLFSPNQLDKIKELKGILDKVF